MSALPAKSFSARGSPCSPRIRARRSPTSSELMPRRSGFTCKAAFRLVICVIHIVIQGSPMRYSLFSVNDHYPKLTRTVPQLYEQVIHSCELAERLGFD